MIVLNDTLSMVIPGVFFVIGFRMLRTMGERQDLDVLEDLKSTQPSERVVALRSEPAFPIVLSRHVLLSMTVLACINLLLPNPTIARLGVSLIMGFAIGYLVKEGCVRRARERSQKGIDYFLPIVMERIVMAVESGLDIIPAIEAVLSLNDESEDAHDPVSEILARIPRYTDAGVGFLEAIDIINHEIDAPSLKHALVHLGIAYREGGEIIHPLRELSDATQLHFQESVEEEIAKMPVKATVPLLCTFGGLIISFLTTPLIQVLSIATKAMPK